MNRMVWSEEFSVGDRKLDEQHQKIISLINRLFDNQDDAHLFVSDRDNLLALMEYSKLHLQYEELLLKKYGYPDFDSYKEANADFIAALEHFSKSVVSGEKYKVSELVLDFLNDWWTNHLLVKDTKYKDFLKGKEVS